MVRVNVDVVVLNLVSGLDSNSRLTYVRARARARVISSSMHMRVFIVQYNGVLLCRFMSIMASVLRTRRISSLRGNA